MYIAVACAAALVSPDLTGIVSKIQHGESVNPIVMVVTPMTYNLFRSMEYQIDLRFLRVVFYLRYLLNQD